MAKLKLACMDAVLVLSLNCKCTTAYAQAAAGITDASVICMGTCQGLFNDIINYCKIYTVSQFNIDVSYIFFNFIIV